jgi:nitroimidazol reductase NimA-like FMN-containing flavoprotein (pyridoxamine 5'-phosphate oxidase superfamily)
MTDPMEFVDLDADACRRLLAGSGIGRVVFTDHAMPAAQPVNYYLDHDEIIFRTRNGAKLAAATRGAVVGFEVDEIDPTTRTGWSVFGVGQAYEIQDRSRLAELATTLPDSWAPGRDAHTIAVPLTRLTGRRIRVVADTPTAAEAVGQPFG